METFSKISKGRLEARECVVGSEFLQAAPGKIMQSNTVRAKSKLQWRLQEERDASNEECLLREATGSVQSLPREEGDMSCG